MTDYPIQEGTGLKIITIQQLYDALDIPARTVMAVYFSMGLTELSFEMFKGKPSPQMQTALDTLVRYGAVNVEVSNSLTGALRYTPAIKRAETGIFRDAMDTLVNEAGARFPVNVDIDPADLDTEKTMRDREREIRRLAKRGETYHHPIEEKIVMRAEYVVVI